jgi:hypothetical protein
MSKAMGDHRGQRRVLLSRPSVQHPVQHACSTVLHACSMRVAHPLIPPAVRHGAARCTLAALGHPLSEAKKEISEEPGSARTGPDDLILGATPLMGLDQVGNVAWPWSSDILTDCHYQNDSMNKLVCLSFPSGKRRGRMGTKDGPHRLDAQPVHPRSALRSSALDAWRWLALVDGSRSRARACTTLPKSHAGPENPARHRRSTSFSNIPRPLENLAALAGKFRRRQDGPR